MNESEASQAQSASGCHKKWIVISVLISGLLTLDLLPYFDYLSKKNKIKRLVPIGSNIDDAEGILKENGFKGVFSKDFATVAKDRYWVDVAVYPSRMPVTVFLGFLVGIRSMSHYVVIEAGLDNKVRKIF